MMDDQTQEKLARRLQTKKACMVYTRTRFKKPVIICDKIMEGHRCIILDLGTHPCAYVGVPSTSKLVGVSSELLPMDCHGGFTYASFGKDYLPEGYYWFGWDYAHAGDFSFISEPEGKKWTVKEIESECWNVAYNMTKLRKLINQVSESEKFEEAIL